MATMPSIIKVGTTLTCILGGKVYTIDHTVRNYQTILDIIKAQKWDELQDQLDISVALAKKSGGRAEIIDGAVYLDGMPVRNVIADRIIDMVDEGFNVDPMLRFLENLNKNPQDFAREELYLFLETNRLPITEDGCFLAYKAVNSDYMDIYSGTIRNKVGDAPEMDRTKVDPDRHRTCSAGLHFCSLSYIQHFARQGSRLMIVKVNPSDVVSIPSDYQNTKGRCWRYEVVDEIALERREEYDRTAPSVVNVKSDAQIEREGIMEFILDSLYFLGCDIEGLEESEIVGAYLEGEDVMELLGALENEYEIEILTEGDPVDPYVDMTFAGIVAQVQVLLRAERKFTSNLFDGDQEMEAEEAPEEEADPLVVLLGEFGLKGQEVNGPVLRGIREKFEVTRLALAEAMGVARGSVWSYEESLVTKPETAEKYLRALLSLVQV